MQSTFTNFLKLFHCSHSCMLSKLRHRVLEKIQLCGLDHMLSLLEAPGSSCLNVPPNTWCNRSASPFLPMSQCCELLCHQQTRLTCGAEEAHLVSCSLGCNEKMVPPCSKTRSKLQCTPTNEAWCLWAVVVWVLAIKHMCCIERWCEWVVMVQVLAIRHTHCVALCLLSWWTWHWSQWWCCNQWSWQWCCIQV